MESSVQRDERLYRAIKRSKPEWLNAGKPTSAMFKDTNGNSVDRDGARSMEEIIRYMQNGTFRKRLKGIVELQAGECMDTGAEVTPAPSEDNPYHANIFLDKEEQKRTLQALMLADISKVIFEDPAVEWLQI